MSPRLGAEKPRPINLNQVILVTDLSIFECHQICDDGSAAFINRLLYVASANTEFLRRASYKEAPVAEKFVSRNVGIHSVNCAIYLTLAFISTTCALSIWELYGTEHVLSCGKFPRAAP
ncbi:unnamed protein product [Nippostrongylus brasiliensis]|uniref:Transmembrane protein n=1 Tax=Nippostrongylus brasiliensis TaxID=27835 RepID=A0A0N4Y0B2_NIPBR|nr:unnamed protein product [Nippostrongylus brasiliensis]